MLPPVVQSRVQKLKGLLRANAISLDDFLAMSQEAAVSANEHCDPHPDLELFKLPAGQPRCKKGGITPQN